MVSTEETYVTAAEVTAADPTFAKLVADEQAALIADASAAIRAACRREFAQMSRVEIHSGRNRPRVWLRCRPVVQIAEVSVNGQALDNSTGTAWTFTPETGELLRGDGLVDPRFAPWFPAGRDNVRVVYAAGYDPFPADLKRATILTVQAIRAAMVIAGPYKSRSIGDYSYTLADAPSRVVPPFARSLISRYIQDDLF